MKKSKKHFRLEFGDNWWSRLLQVLYWTPAIASVVTGNFVGAGIYLILVFLIWRLLQWIVNGSTPKTGHKVKSKINPQEYKPNRPLQIILGIFLAIFLFSTVLMFFI